MKNKNFELYISIVDTGGMGGAEIFLESLGSALKKEGVKVTFLTLKGVKYENFLRKKGHSVITLPKRLDITGNWKGLVKAIIYLPYFLLASVFVILRIGKSKRPVLFISGFSDKIIFSPLARLLDISVVWMDFAALGDVFRRNLRIPEVLYKLAKNFADFVIVPSQNTKQQLLSQTRILPEKIKLIPLGIETISDSKLKEIKNSRDEIRKKLGVKGKKVIGMVSRVEPEKGQDTLIKAASILKEEMNDFVVLIVGEGDLEYLNKIVSKLGVSKFVKFLGYKEGEEKLRIMSAFDLAVFPTRWELEGFGLVSVEAMMMEIPLVASNFGPVPEVVGNAAGLCKPEPEDLAREIKKILKNKKYARKLTVKGRKRAKNLFDIRNIAKEYLKVFERLH